MVDKNDIEINSGDVIDIHQTVNGQNLFIVRIIKDEYNVTYLDGRKYEYDKMELLENHIYGEKEIEIIGNIDNIDNDKNLLKRILNKR